MTRNFLTLLLAVTLAVSTACTASDAKPQTGPTTSAASPANSGAQAITIDNFSFSPAVLTVAPGTTVTWTNHDDIPHTVVETSHKFRSQALDTNDAFSYTFTEAGTYEYFCGLHPKMVGKVVVKK